MGLYKPIDINRLILHMNHPVTLISEGNEAYHITS